MSSVTTYRKQRSRRLKKRSGKRRNTDKDAEVVSRGGEASSPVAAPVSLITASGKKLALSRPSSSTCEPSHGACSSDSQCGMKGLRLIDLESLLASVSRRASCNVCGSSLTVKEDLVLRSGICTKLSLSCTDSLCAGSDDAFCDPSKHSKAYNSRFILAGRMCGRGRAGLETISGFLGLPPPLTYRAFSDYNLSLNKIIQEASIESQLSVSAPLHSLYDTKPNDIIDVTVTCDGTWSKRGFTALYGVVVVMSWDSGQVLDAVALSKQCNVCKQKESTMDEQEFLEWYAVHEESCNSNYLGSSPAMEAEGTSRLFARSVERLGIRYKRVICDGDSKSMVRVNSEQPYGSDVEIEVIYKITFVISYLFFIIVFLTISEVGVRGACPKATRKEVARPQEEDLQG